MGPGTPRGAGPLALAAPAAPDENLAHMATWLRPLASPVRLRLLRFLTRPHYLEEVAGHLGLTRQAARKHLDKLVAIGVLERRSGTRDAGSVMMYVINPQALFLLYDEFEKLASLRRDGSEERMVRTFAEPGKAAPGAAAEGPCLWVVRGLQAGARAELVASRPWVIGRDERCDLVVAHDRYASNRHAEVRWQGSGFVLTDLRSTNGTLHNWRTLPRGHSVHLRHGDLLGVGRTCLLFWGSP